MPPELKLNLELFTAAQNAGIQITKEGPKPDPALFGKSNGRLTLKAFNRGKLLLSYFSDLPTRQLELFVMLSNGSSQLPDLLSITPSSSQLQHREAFFRAVATGDQRTAAKMLGRLREEEHDAGELAFLEATEAFHSRHYSEAIGYARRVPATALDWLRAFMLILESHAFRGDVESLEGEIRSAAAALPPFFVPYVYQVAIENCESPEVHFEKLFPIVQSHLAVARPETGVFYMWNRHSCSVAVEFIENQQQLALCEEAAGQGGTHPVELGGPCSKDPDRPCGR